MDLASLLINEAARCADRADVKSAKTRMMTLHISAGSSAEPTVSHPVGLHHLMRTDMTGSITMHRYRVRNEITGKWKTSRYVLTPEEAARHFGPGNYERLE